MKIEHACEFCDFPILKQYIVVGVAQMVETYLDWTWSKLIHAAATGVGFDPGWVKIFVATLNGSELHHRKCVETITINNFCDIMNVTADHTCRRNEDKVVVGLPESWEVLLLHLISVF